MGVIRLFRWLFFGDGHKHEWETMKTANLMQDGICVGQRYFQRCTKCGKMKKVDLY